ncbi:Rrf2 family transcriptional regulator [Rhizobium sp. CSW-27]|uniref:RrF2 family transcriptional regulator n=1 Tax=Rhizobium sp. CSW-27 TaxID=2839985 RepID=UPI001C0327E2|nr:Rrf2 family transcriptional regulator [Rhizobium sp. CSW-27]MBT9371218.1 Rrf2 family transcriptional regulator [Rhizobium sp. CSW-27]
MRLTRQCEIAFAILATCAGSPTRVMTTLQVAKASVTTKDHAAQVVSLLAREGFLRTERGRGGGITLALPAADILLGDVLRRVQPDLVQRAGQGDIFGHGVTHHVTPAFAIILFAAEAAFLTFMDRFSVADLVGEAAIQRFACLDCRLLDPVLRKRNEVAARTALPGNPEPLAAPLPDRPCAGVS